MSTIQELQNRVKELEEELKNERNRQAGAVRTKIDQMSSEVVDTNPYRLIESVFVSLVFFSYRMVELL